MSITQVMTMLSIQLMGMKEIQTLKEAVVNYNWRLESKV